MCQALSRRRRRKVADRPRRTLPRGGPRCAPVADPGFRRPACSPLAVVASELTLGATACESRGQACGNADMVARQPSSKQKQMRPGTRAAVDTPSMRRKSYSEHMVLGAKNRGKGDRTRLLGLRALDALPRVAVLVVLGIAARGALALAQLVQVDLFEHGLFDLIGVVGVHVESGR